MGGAYFVRSSDRIIAFRQIVRQFELRRQQARRFPSTAGRTPRPAPHRRVRSRRSPVPSSRPRPCAVAADTRVSHSIRVMRNGSYGLLTIRLTTPATCPYSTCQRPSAAETGKRILDDYRLAAFHFDAGSNSAVISSGNSPSMSTELVRAVKTSVAISDCCRAICDVEGRAARLFAQRHGHAHRQHVGLAVAASRRCTC